MKQIAITLLFLLIQSANVVAQCQSPLTVYQLISLKTDFSSAEDLLLGCYWKSEVETLKYSKSVSKNL